MQLVSHLCFRARYVVSSFILNFKVLSEVPGFWEFNFARLGSFLHCNCNYAAHRWCLVSGDEYWFRMVGFIYCLEDSTQKCYSQRSCPSDYVRHIYTPCIHFYLRDKIHRSHQGLIKRSRLSAYSLLTLSPFPLFLHWSLPLPFCLLFIFPSSSISWAMLAVSISFCNLDFLGCHVFNIWSGHIQLFRERLSEEMHTRQSWKVIWDMINTLFLIL